MRQRAITAADGNPRLLDWLDLIVADTTLDINALLTAIENTTDRFREDILAEKLLSTQDPELRRMLSAVSVIELPVPAETVHAIHQALSHRPTPDHTSPAPCNSASSRKAPTTTGDHRYYVTNLLRPLLPLTDDEHTHACAAAAQSLYPLWITDPEPGT